MARQVGIIKLEGGIGDLSFYKTKDGHLARTKGGVDGKRIASDPAFQRTRENGSEFGTSAKGSKLLRTALRLLLQNASDSRVSNRLTKRVLEIVKTDATNERGLRVVSQGDITQLDKFEFNIGGKLSSLLFAPYDQSIDRTSGAIVMSLPDFIPVNSIVAPKGTTHFKIVVGGAEVNFDTETFVFDSDASAILPWDAATVAALVLTAGLTANSTNPIFQVIGVEFYQEVNGQMYSLKNGAYNALAIVGVDTP